MLYPVLAVLALSLDMVPVAWYSSNLQAQLQQKTDIGRMTWLFPLIRTVMLVAGYVIGSWILSLSGGNTAIGYILLLAVAVKMMYDSYTFRYEERVYASEENKMLVLLAVAGSINTFLGGIGLGLLASGLRYPALTQLVAAFVLLFLSINAGNQLGYRNGLKFTGLAGGILLFLLTVFQWIRL